MASPVTRSKRSSKSGQNRGHDSRFPALTESFSLVRADFVGNWAAGTSGQLLKASDWGSGTWRAHATANRSRPLNAPQPLYRRRGGRHWPSNWAAGSGASLIRNAGADWALFAAHDPNYPSIDPVPLYGAASDGAQAAPYLGDACVHYGVRGVNGSGPFGGGPSGGAPLQLAGNTWHTTSYKLYCGGESRRDFRPYDTISFVSIQPRRLQPLTSLPALENRH